jgi:hypothetical protein
MDARDALLGLHERRLLRRYTNFADLPRWEVSAFGVMYE